MGEELHNYDVIHSFFGGLVYERFLCAVCRGSAWSSSQRGGVRGRWQRAVAKTAQQYVATFPPFIFSSISRSYEFLFVEVVPLRAQRVRASGT
jgi:hypothetical protein